MKKSHLVIIGFQLAIIAIIIVMLGNQAMMLREIREEVTKPQQEIDLTVRTNGVILDLPNPSFVLFEGDVWQEDQLQYRQTGDDLLAIQNSFPILSIEQIGIPEGSTLERVVVETYGFSESMGSSQVSDDGAIEYRSESINDFPVMHVSISDTWPASHVWYMVDPRDASVAYVFTWLGSDDSSFYAEWILETLRFE